MCVELISVIANLELNSIPEECYVSGLCDDIARQPPRAAIDEIRVYCTRAVTPDMKARIMRMMRCQAAAIQIETLNPSESLGGMNRSTTTSPATACGLKQLASCDEHRRNMVCVGVTDTGGIEAEDEREYLIYIITGLSNRPSLQSQIAMLRTT